ncbi:uncharacterized protein BJ171DRAFT_188194 [Polychytrium aggregatum]|uniref:uncharacterized protein n=1 Tax=Polychytrium aggregatum TaxID=110093 RepID=UPI0022FE62FB|nr:uncharacterized protein BJ171DRAFT_188194 [Polychytrium aggregatum]KAI9202256.1 hypothetical protein BJ171DRAFT_188194 [Polychytrium aggregatum]
MRVLGEEDALFDYPSSTSTVALWFYNIDFGCDGSKTRVDYNLRQGTGDQYPATCGQVCSLPPFLVTGTGQPVEVIFGGSTPSVATFVMDNRQGSRCTGIDYGGQTLWFYNIDFSCDGSKTSVNYNMRLGSGILPATCNISKSCNLPPYSFLTRPVEVSYGIPSAITPVMSSIKDIRPNSECTGIDYGGNTLYFKNTDFDCDGMNPRVDYNKRLAFNSYPSSCDSCMLPPFAYLMRPVEVSYGIPSAIPVVMTFVRDNKPGSKCTGIDYSGNVLWFKNSDFNCDGMTTRVDYNNRLQSYNTLICG